MSCLKDAPDHGPASHAAPRTLGRAPESLCSAPLSLLGPARCPACGRDRLHRPALEGGRGQRLSAEAQGQAAGGAHFAPPLLSRPRPSDQAPPMNRPCPLGCTKE